MLKQFSFILALLLTVGAQAETATLNIDPTHSSVNFTIRHLVSKVKGSFNDLTGTLTVDEKAPEKSSVKAVIKTASIDTNNKKRDDHLKDADFFDAAKHPEITFVSKKITGKGKKWKVDGTLSMHGVEKPVTLDMEYLGSEKDPQGKTRAGFSAKTKIKRKDFGISWNKTLDKGGLMLGEDVDVEIEIEAIKEETQTATK